MEIQSTHCMNVQHPVSYTPESAILRIQQFYPLYTCMRIIYVSLFTTMRLSNEAAGA